MSLDHGNDKSPKPQTAQEAFDELVGNTKSKLDRAWSEVASSAADAMKEMMTAVEVLRPFRAQEDEVKKIVAYKSYEKGVGEWRKINSKLAAIHITENDIRKLQNHLKLTPDGRMGPRTIAGLTRMLGEKFEIKYGKRSVRDQVRIKEIEAKQKAKATPATPPVQPAGPASAPVPAVAPTIGTPASAPPAAAPTAPASAAPASKAPNPPFIQPEAPYVYLPTPATPTNPHDAADAPVDEERDDTTYAPDADAAAEALPVHDEGLLLNKEQAMAETFKILTKGHLTSANYSKEKREAWTKEIIAQMEATKISFTRQHILMIAVTIDRESGFKEMPVVNDPEAVLDRKLAEEMKEHWKLRAIPDSIIRERRQEAVAFINERRKYNLEHGLYRVTSSGKRVGVFTEKDLDMGIDYVLREYEDKVPSILTPLYPKDKIEKYRPKTLGAMQVSVSKAMELAAKYEGKQIPERQMRDILNTREGGLKYGLYYMKEVLASHEKEGPLDEQNVKFAFLDYNMGAFSARNAGIQAALNRFPDIKLDLDGDLLIYDAKDKPIDEKSLSERAIRDVLDKYDIEISDGQIRADLLKEKTIGFEKTRTYLELTRLFRNKGFALTKVLPTVKAKGSYVKSGTNDIGASGYVKGSYRRYRRVGSV